MDFLELTYKNIAKAKLHSVLSIYDVDLWYKTATETVMIAHHDLPHSGVPPVILAPYFAFLQALPRMQNP